ncbi:MAG TPA: hypothetical protein VLC49_02605 [Solirubrobacteraceae bacterium]|nr:hypothetical protein [Solirubrobacteraceae bacterium]
MSVPTAELTAPAPPTDVAARAGMLRQWVRGWRFYVWLAGAAVLIGAVSLLIPSTPSYDPWAWLVWGREIAHINLQTTGGPSWKPLPVLFTTVFAVFGKAQPDLWLVIARAGAVMAVAMVFKLAWRLTTDLVGVAKASSQAERSRRLAIIAPLLAGLIAAGSLINSSGFISNNALGYSEGLATALALIAVDSYLDGAPRRAFVIGFFAALDRPELWFIWGPYGLYLFWRDPGARKLVVALFALIPVLWFLPELWGSGHLLRGVTRAQHPRSNSAAFTKCPVCTVFRKEAWPAVWDRVKVPGMIAMLVAAVGLWRTREAWWKRRDVSPGVRARAWLLGLGVFGYAWWLGVAIETQAGFSGNNRYLVLGTAPVAIVGGVAWGWFSRALGDWLRRLSARGEGAGGGLTSSFSIPAGTAVAVVLFLALPSWIGKGIVSLPRTHHALVYQAKLRSDLSAAVAKAGGADALLRCGPVMTEGFQVPMVAWTLGVHTLRIEATPSKIVGPPWPAVILQTRAQSNSHLLPTPAQIIAWEHDGARYQQVAHVRTFRVFSTCAGKVSQ